MSETKRVPMWGEIFKVEKAIGAIGDASAEIARVGSIVDLGDKRTGEALGAAMAANDVALRSLRDWCASTRLAREAADLERKKAGLL